MCKHHIGDGMAVIFKHLRNLVYTEKKGARPLTLTVVRCGQARILLPIKIYRSPSCCKTYRAISRLVAIHAPRERM